MSKEGLSEKEELASDEEQEEKQPLIKKPGALTVPHLPTGFSPYRNGKRRARSVSSVGMTEFTLENMKDSYNTWINFGSAPKELWLILFAKLSESWCFVTEDFTFMLYF